jgi:hypothetical protein
MIRKTGDITAHAVISPFVLYIQKKKIRKAYHMFMFVIILAVASTAIELMLAAKIPAWRKNAHKYKLVNLGFSIVLSFVIGILFGAAGLIAMTAAILSTIMSIPGYKVLHWRYDSPTAVQRGGDQVAYHVNRWKQVISDFFKLVYKILRIITFPFWAFRAVRDRRNTTVKP